MKKSLAILALLAAACGGNDDSNNGEPADDLATPDNGAVVDDGKSDVPDDVTEPEEREPVVEETVEDQEEFEPSVDGVFAASSLMGSVEGIELDLEGLAVASTGTDGSVILLMADRDLACDDLTLAPGERYAQFRFRSDDGELAPGTNVNAGASLEAKIVQMPEACAGPGEVLATNQNLREFEVRLAEADEERVRGDFDVVVYDGKEEGTVAGTFDAVRCNSTPLPVCVP